MSRYIKLADALQTLADTCYLDEIDKNMQELPSIDIVFCKDCEHYNAGFECLIEGYGIERSPMWFCADGERREP